MLPLSKLIRTIGFRREKMVQTVTWLSSLPKEFVDLSIRSSMSVLTVMCRVQTSELILKLIVITQTQKI